MACLGVAKAVKERQTNTGTKDAFTQIWIEKLIGDARDMKKAQANRSAESIQLELYDWVIANESKIYNAFLTLKGLSFLCRFLGANALIMIQALIQQSTHPLRFFTLFY